QPLTSAHHPPPPTHVYTLSLHDALPISLVVTSRKRSSSNGPWYKPIASTSILPCSSISYIGLPNHHDQKLALARSKVTSRIKVRSEEHTSELQSRFDLVCRLLLEKKNIT